MMKYFITGITGFTGQKLAEELTARGHFLRGLVRDKGKIPASLQAGVVWVEGNLSDREALQRLVAGCDGGFHLAANTSVWPTDPDAHIRDNVTGTLNVLEVAREAGVKKTVIVSTAGVFGPSRQGGETTEASPRPAVYHTKYETSKALMELEVKKRDDLAGLWVMVHPTRVYGPGILNHANSVTRIIDRYRRGKWRILPGTGRPKGNYVYIDDVVNGMILAMEKGKPGENYLLGGETLSFREFFQILGQESGRPRVMVPVPGALLIGMARIISLPADLAGRTPLITPSFMKRYLHHWMPSSEKAVRDLGYRITPFREGVRKTLKWLQETEMEKGR
ncbi:MAG TPA: NAD-dependent epimerase/dehydratase family protein [Bacteroidetes bacterium]|nr:NAD-dependent epimerase/dehydratase family protein [Bacteroidota bacterium]